jgi:hypothetical protein
MDVSILKKVALESSKASSAMVANLTNTEQTITRQQSKIKERSSELVIAKPIIDNLQGIKEGLESDVAYLVDQQKYSTFVDG